MKSSSPLASSQKEAFPGQKVPWLNSKNKSYALTKCLGIIMVIISVVQLATINRAYSQTCSTVDFSASINTSSSQAANTWYTDRFAPASFVSQQTGGSRNNVLKHSIAASNAQTTSHENTQGRKYDLPLGSRTIQVSLFIPSDWESANRRMAGLWGTAYDASNVFTNASYPIIEFISEGGVAKFRGYESGTGTWTYIPTPTEFVTNSWVTFKIELKSDKQYIYSVTAANGNVSSITTTTHPNTTEYIGNAILQGYNTVPPGVDYAIFWDNFAASTGAEFISNVQTGELFCTIQNAIDDAETLAGHTIKVPAGTFSGSVVINKELTISGASMGTTILTDATDYGIYTNADGITVENLTVTGSPLQGFLTNCGADNLTVNNVTIEKSGKSGFNINGVNGALLTNVFAHKNIGTGISISDSKDVTINGVTTSENAFAGGFSSGIGIFSGGACSATVGMGTTNIEIGETANITEPFGIYQQGASISNLSLPPAYTHFTGIASNDRYYTKSKDESYIMASTFIANPTAAKTVYVEEISSGNHYVNDLIPSAGVPGNYTMSIQGAIDYLAAGNTIFVEDGIYNERVSITKALKITGTSKSGTILNGTGLAGAGSGFEIETGTTNVNIQNFTIQNFAGTNPNSTAGIFSKTGNDGLSIKDVLIKDNTNSSGIFIQGGTSIEGITIDGAEVLNHGAGARGIVIWDGFKKNITIQNSTIKNNSCCGIELQDGTATGVTITGNTIEGNDSAISAVGLTSGSGTTNANTISNNTITVKGRFGIEVKNPNGTGLTSGDGAILINSNTITYIGGITEVRDLAGIAVHRRGVLAGNVDVPNGVQVNTNTVSNFVQPSTSEGFGIVIEGTNHTVTNNILTGNDIGLQQQAGHLPYPADGNQNDINDTYFGRGNSSLTCGNTITGNTGTNTINTRNVGTSVGGGLVTNTNTSKTFCSIQTAINDATTLNGHTLSLGDGTYKENVAISKSLTIKAASNNADNVIITPATSGSGTGLSITAANVKLDYLTVTNFNYGVVIQTNANNLTLDHSKINNNIAVGIRVPTSATNNGNLTIDNSEVKNNSQGIAAYTNTAVTNNAFDVIKIHNTDFSDNKQKGIYMERASNLLIDGIVMNASGADGTYNSNNGIDLNLQHGTYSNIVIKNSTFNGSGLKGAGSNGGPAAINVKARSDRSGIVDNVLLEGNTISGAQNSIIIGFASAGLSNVKIQKNNLSGSYANKSIINYSNANIAVLCNWHGVTTPSAIEATFSKVGTGNIVLGSYSSDNQYTCTPTSCNITAINTSDGNSTISSPGSTRIGDITFTSPAGYDSYVWSACSNGTSGSCNVAITGTGNSITREFAQIGNKGVKLVRTIGGETQTCYFFFSINPFINTSTGTACSIVLRKNGSSGANQWYKDGSEIVGAIDNNYTATESGSYVLKVTIGTDIFESAPKVVSLSGFAITTQPLPTQTVCQNASTADLTIASTPAAVSYQWFVNTSNSNVGGTALNGATSATFSPPATTSGSYYYYAVATLTGGCTATSNVSEVIITPAPLPGSYVISATETCQGTPITITGSGLLADADTKIFYTLTSPSESGLPSSPPPFTGIATGGILASNSPANLIPGTYSVTVTSVEANGCTTPVVSAPTLSWTVSPAVNYALKFGTGNTPVADGNSFTLCKNESVPLEITGTAGQTYTLTRAANAEWMTPIVISGNVGDPAQNLPAQMSWNGNWTLVVTNGSCSKSISFNVTVNQPNGLTSIGTSATVAISAGTNDLISNCGFIGTISSASLTGSTVNVATTEVSGARKYAITPTAGTTYSANLVLYFSQADFDAFNNASDIDIPTSSTDLTGVSRLRILHTGTSTETIFPTSVAWNGTKSWWEVSFAVSHFSTFELAASNASLPVVLTSFKAVKENNTTQLTWATTSESNSDHFDVQHSVNGKNWLSIGKREAMGDNTGIKSYSFNHATPALGENLYRLKMIDRDGTFAYSSIESVNFGSNQMVTLYPNPVSDRLLIDTQQWKNVSGVKLIDLNGRTVYSSDKGKLTNSIDVKSLASGTYLVEISHNNGQVTASKIVVMR